MIGAPLALAAGPQPLSFYCDSYTQPFVSGGLYNPDNFSTACTYSLPTIASTSIEMTLYQGTPGNATPLKFDAVFSPQAPSVQTTQGNSFGIPPAGTDFFAVAYGFDDFSQVDSEANPYFTTGAGTPPQSYYILQFKWGTPLTVVADDKTINAGALVPTFTVTMSGFEGSDTQVNSTTGSADCTTNAPDTNTVGDYTITCTQGTLSSSKYSFSPFIPGTLHIVPAPPTSPLTITANDATATYGSLVQILSALITGFVNGDTLATSDVTGSPSCTTTATASSPVGSYPITCTVGTLSSVNYTFTTFFPGLYTITKAPLTVTANDMAMVAGSALPTLTATLSGFVNGEVLGTSGVSGAAACTTPATSASPAGAYPITCAVGSLTAGNYDFTTFIDGTLTVTSPTGPIITITNPLPNLAYTKSDSVLLGDTIVDTFPIVATTTLFNGVPFDPTQPIPFYTASPGTSTVTVAARDSFGAWATSSVQFLITRPGGDDCYNEAEGWWNRGWVWTSDDFYHVLLDCSDLDNFHRDRHDLENSHNHDSNWKQKDKEVSDGVKDRNDDMDKRVHKNGH